MAKSIVEQVSDMLVTGRAAVAATAIEKLLQGDPKNEGLWLLLAQIHERGTNRFDLALKCAERIIKLAPNNHSGWLEAARALDRLERPTEAEEHVKRALRLAPTDADAIRTHAVILANLDKTVEAQNVLQGLIKLDPGDLTTRIRLAHLLVRIGSLDEARTLAHELHEQHPDHAMVYSVLSESGTWRKDDPALKYLEMELIPKRRAENSPHLPELLMILAKASNDLNEYDRSMALWGEAKKVEGRKHDATVYRNFVNGMVKNVNRSTFLGNPGLKTEKSVFIVGMPRSGSTLLAQIISAHPKVESIGESPALEHASKVVGIRPLSSDDQAKFILGLTDKDRVNFAKSYQAGALKLRAERVLDKRLHNFERLALVGATLPNARIIHALRDPMDNCVSCYMQKLVLSHNYTGSLAELGKYYCEYRRLMDHWKVALPNPIIEAHYEDVVANTEEQARKLVDFIGLDWDPACLEFQNNTTPVRTLSNWQVRQPIYKTSVQRWRRYDAHLGPLKSALAQFYPDGLD